VPPTAVHPSSDTATSLPNNAALPASTLAATSQAKPTTTDSRETNAQPTNSTTTGNISGDGNSSISHHYYTYNPAGDRLINMIEGTPARDEGDSSSLFSVHMAHSADRCNPVFDPGGNTFDVTTPV
jgi:hypothetical protein